MKWRNAYIRYTDGESFTHANRTDYLKPSGWNMLLNRLAELVTQLNCYFKSPIKYKEMKTYEFAERVAMTVLEELDRRKKLKE